MPEHQGLFLGTTWRLHPAIADLTSIMYYEDRLKSWNGLNIQKLEGASPFCGSGLFYVPVDHAGNQSQSDEDVDAIVKIVNDHMKSKTTGTDRDVTIKRLAKEDIKIIAPYNMLVTALRLASPRLFEVECNTIEQMKWANGICLFKEITSIVE